MSRLIPFAVVALLGVGSLQAQETTAPATVVAMGEGSVHAPADRAVVTLATETHADTAAETQHRGNALMKAVQAAIDDLKLAGGQVTTTGLMLSPNWIYGGSGQRTQRGFVGRHAITVRFDEPGRAGEVVAAAVSAGANDVSNIQFDRRDRRTLEQEALKAAVQDARARADALAAGAGHAVNRIIRVEEATAAALRADVVTGMSPTYRSGVGAAPIAQGDVEIRARVVLTAAAK